jgi:hypothetical protein
LRQALTIQVRQASNLPAILAPWVLGLETCTMTPGMMVILRPHNRHSSHSREQVIFEDFQAMSQSFQEIVSIIF